MAACSSLHAFDEDPSNFALIGGKPATHFLKLYRIFLFDALFHFFSSALT